MKRGREAQDSFDDFSHRLSSQQSISSTLSGIEEVPSCSNREWRTIFPELIGYVPDQSDNIQLDTSQPSELDDDLWSADIGRADIETWMNQELEEDTQHDDSFHIDTLHDESSNQELTCYGMIYRARVKLIGNMSTVTETLHRPGKHHSAKGSHFLLDIVCENDHLYVKVNHGIRLAELNKQLDESLKKLVSSQAIYLEAVIHQRTLFDDIGFATKEHHAQTQININVYGPGPSTSTVGRHLSEHKVWLQRPDWYKPGCTYANPHVIDLNDLAEDLQKISVKHEGVTQSEEDSLQSSIQGVYSMLTRDAYLDSNLSEDSRLATPLMDHQIKAQTFMTQRETGPIPEQFELWETMYKDTQIWYKHKVAGIRSRTKPTEIGGGILADEMGMGKTFSMLSLIVSSLEAAHKWAGDSETKLTDDIRPLQQLSRATLIVVPSSLLLTTWIDEIASRLKIKLKWFIHHGRDRPIYARDLYDYDVVLTTYHTIHADYQKKRDPISGTAWYRIVLDEAHIIRSSTTHLHKRVVELDAKYRWCLTGTPIQNRLEDAGALLAFLKIFPFDRMSVFRQCVTVPFGEGGIRKIVAQENLAKLLDAMCIRRTKGLLNLNDFEERIYDVCFSPQERSQYEKTKQDMKRTMQNLNSEAATNNRFGAFQAQLQLRLLCNHGTYQQQFHWARARNLLDEQEDAVSSLAWANAEGTCSVCSQLIPSIHLIAARALQISCAHMLCQECRQGSDGGCPLCSAAAFRHKHDQSGGSSRTTQAREAYFQTSGYSSKMMALVQELQRTNLKDKSIVFSHLTTTLDLIGQHLRRNNIYFERIDGNDNLAHRKKTLDKFRNDSSLRILVMTTGVGALGLDLIAANRVHLIEPQWNPSIELQAIGRTLRIGQQRSVTVVRYIVQDSVEQYMKHLQQNKLKMAGMAQTKNAVPFNQEPEVKREILNDFLR